MGLPKTGVAFSFPIPGLVSQADTKLLITNPTIAAGDFVVWNPNGAGSYDNLATTPTAIGAGAGVLISLSATEMGYLVGNGILVKWEDAAGAQWCSGGATIIPSARNLEDLAYPTTTGRSMDVDANGGVEVGSFQADAIDAGAIKADAVTKIQAGLSTLDADDVHDEVIEGALTFRQMMRIILAACANVLSGGGTTTITIKDLANTKPRITATVDSSGNRTNVTLDGS